MQCVADSIRKKSNLFAVSAIGIALALSSRRTFLEIPRPGPKTCGAASQGLVLVTLATEDGTAYAQPQTILLAASVSACAGLMVVAAGTSTSIRRARQVRRAVVHGRHGLGARIPEFTWAPPSGGSSTLFCSGGACSVNLARPGLEASVRSGVARRAMMFERFTEKTVKAVMLAQGESRRLAKGCVGTEMLVVGVLAEGTDDGFRALMNLGLHLPEARAKLEQMVGRGANENAFSVPFTARAKKVLEDSIYCAREQGRPSATTAHLLCAILREVDGKGVGLLQVLLRCDSVAAVSTKVLGELIREGSLAATGAVTQQELARPDTPCKVGTVKLEETLKYSTDLTAMAREGKLDPLVGREYEMSRTIRILGRCSKNNPVLLGDAGIGKTTLAHGLAQRIAKGCVPMTLRDKIMIQFDMALLLAGARYRGDFEERLQAIVREVTNSNRRVIVVIDELHTLISAGSGGGTAGSGMDAAGLLKPALARGELQCLGMTTTDEYRKYIEQDPALQRRFQPVHVLEPSEAHTVQILRGLAPKYERHHQLRYTPEALVAAVKLASQYIADRSLPDKAIDVMDEAGSKVRQQLFQEVEGAEIAQEHLSVSRELEDVQKEKRAAVVAEQYERAQHLKLRETDLIGRLEILQGKMGHGGKSTQHIAEGDLAGSLQRQVMEEDVAQIVAEWTGIAVERVGARESARLMNLEEELNRSIIGQNDAVESVCKALRRARLGLRDPVRPIAGLMFCGPTGVGKTELCRILATTFFGTRDALTCFDMSEYMEKHTVSKLIGAPPGYVGYNDGGLLIEAVRRRPYSILLFDEVEKAHPDVFNIMLQVLDNGRLTDSKGRTVSFSNAMVIMTSNLGSRSVQKAASGGLGLGFETAGDDDDSLYSRMKDWVHEEMKTFFRPEFLNRLDDMVVFRPLTRENVRDIAEVEFCKVLARLSERGLDVSLTDRFKARVVEEGFDPAYGARPLHRAIRRLLEDTLAEHVLTSMGREDGLDQTSQDRAASRPNHAIEVGIADDGKVVVRGLRHVSVVGDSMTNGKSSV